MVLSNSFRGVVEVLRQVSVRINSAYFQLLIHTILILSRCAVARLICSHGNAHDAAGRFVCLDIFRYCVALRY
jgi:hypothetical protein